MPQKTSVVRNVAWLLLKLVFLLIFVALAIAQAPYELDITLDPATTTVHWTLGDILHTVHGTFRLKKGIVRYDPLTGNATGRSRSMLPAERAAVQHATREWTSEDVFYDKRR